MAYALGDSSVWDLLELHHLLSLLPALACKQLTRSNNVGRSGVPRIWVKPRHQLPWENWQLAHSQIAQPQRGTVPPFPLSHHLSLWAGGGSRMQTSHINGVGGNNSLEKHKKEIPLYPTFMQCCMDYNVSECGQHNLSTCSYLVYKLGSFLTTLILQWLLKNFKPYIVVPASVIIEFGKYRQEDQTLKVILGYLTNSDFWDCVKSCLKKIRR